MSNPLKCTLKVFIYLVQIGFKYFGNIHVSLSMMRLLSSEVQERKKDFEKDLNPVMLVFIIALAEHSQMSTYVPGFQSFSSVFFFASFFIGQISHQQNKG